MKLTARDRQIVSALSAHVRLFSLEQIAAHWWTETGFAESLAAKRMEVLTEEGLVTSLKVAVRPLPLICEPVVEWKPGEPEPNLGAAAWKLQSRWVGDPTKTMVYLATKAASKLFGGKANGSLSKPYQATHDLGVAAIYLHFSRHDSELLQYWVGEDVLAPHRRGQKLPDAVIAPLPGATPQLVLEFGGAYDKARLIDFHTDCSQRLLPYEIW